MATRLIDAHYQFNGRRTSASQALQWPRTGCPDPDRAAAGSGWLLRGNSWVEENVVPSAVVQATCEIARELLIADRTAAPAGEGIDVIQTTQASHNPADSGSQSSSSMTKYDKADRRPIISRVAQAMLSKFGSVLGSSSGVVPLVRV